MLQKFQNFKKKYLTLPWITLAVCVAILVINIFKGPAGPQRGPGRGQQGAGKVEVKP